MTDRPIIFSAPMVRALLDGRKSQTRRLLKLAGRSPDYIGPAGCQGDPTCWGWEMPDLGGYVTIEGDDKDHLPGWRNGWRDWQGAYAPGDRLYVREHWRCPAKHDATAPRDLTPRSMTIAFEAGGSIANQDSRDDWRPSSASYTGADWMGRFRQAMHMPRWASRLTLTVTGVRVQRLQDISEADAVAEGVIHDGFGGWRGHEGTIGYPTAIWAYHHLWNSLHGPGAWDANPWVVALTFTVQRGNIDQLPGVAG